MCLAGRTAASAPNLHPVFCEGGVPAFDAVFAGEKACAGGFGTVDVGSEGEAGGCAGDAGLLVGVEGGVGGGRGWLGGVDVRGLSLRKGISDGGSRVRVVDWWWNSYDG